jgi:hypothetical protein
MQKYSFKGSSSCYRRFLHINSREWFDMSIVKNQGRAFEPELTLKSADDCVLFPKLKSINLLSQNIVLPDDFKGKVKLVCLSFKHFG